jgi:hypothetical protein
MGVSTVHDVLVALAGSTDDSPAIDPYLRLLVELVPSTVGPVDYASVTVHRDGHYATVARSDELAQAIDSAQYADDEGPCLEALDTRTAVGVADTAAADGWPRFREKAFSVGVYASLSVPLFTGAGTVVAALNLYAHDPTAMAGLIARVVDLYHGRDRPSRNLERTPLDEGSAQFVDALSAALRVYDDIQHALGLLIGRDQVSAAVAYLCLCEAAAKEGLSLHDAAMDLLDRREA